MRPKTLILVVALALALLYPHAAQAYVTWVNPLGGGDGSENSLSQILLNLYGPGNTLRIADGPSPGDQIWHNPDGQARAEVKWAADESYFGYEAGLGGGIGPGNFNSLLLVEDQGPLDNWISLPSKGPKGSGPIFRFGLNDVTTNSYWSSLQSDNPGGRDHEVTYLITGGLSKGDYALGWEDRDLGDQDYQDAVVQVHGLSPVPEPGTLTLLALCGGFAAVLYRRRRNS